MQVASLAALVKPDSCLRVVHDATNGLQVNSRIKIKSQVALPTAGEIRRSLQALGRATFTLSADVKRAHRLCKIRREEWGYQACRTGIQQPGDPGPMLWLNKVGTFGVSPASFHWARLMGAIARATWSLMGVQKLMQLVYVDDIAWQAAGPAALEDIVLALFFMVVVGLPISWKKVNGGVTQIFVGFHYDLVEYRIGITTARADWLSDWMSRVLTHGIVAMEDMASFLGRMAFTTTAVEVIRPFLGPMYAWVTAVPASAVLPLPKAIRLLFAFLVRQLRAGLHTQSVGTDEQGPELFRTDAKAEGEEVWVAGWCCADSSDPRACRWFSERLDRRNSAWLFEAGEPYRSIATLELLGTVLALRAFDVKARGPSIMACSAGTDNLGNRFAVGKMMSTKFPLNIMLMEVANECLKRDLQLSLHWLPRLQNTLADALTNQRVRVCVSAEEGTLMHDMLSLGRSLYEDLKEAKSKKSQPSHKRRKKEKEPWS